MNKAVPQRVPVRKGRGEQGFQHIGYGQRRDVCPGAGGLKSVPFAGISVAKNHAAESGGNPVCVSVQQNGAERPAVRGFLQAEIRLRELPAQGQGSFQTAADEQRALPRRAAFLVVGLLLCYALGTVWFVRTYTAAPMTFGKALSMCVFPFLLPDAVKLALAVVLSLRLRPVLLKLR